MSNLTSRVRNGKIPQPTQRGFTKKKWLQEFNKLTSPSDEDIKLYESGEWAFDKFEIIRNELTAFNLDDVSNQTLIRMLVGTVNRATHVLSHAHIPTQPSGIRFAEQPLQTGLGKINRVSPKATPDMVLMSSIDGLRYPLRMVLSRQKDPTTTLADEEVFAKVHGAMILGQYYDHIDAYWMKCLWNGCHIDVAGREDLVIAPDNDFTRIEAVSDYRRQVLTAELIFHFQSIWNKFDDEIQKGFLSSTPQINVKGSGKKRKYDIRPYKTDDTRSKIIIVNRIISDKDYYTPFFKEELPKLTQITVDDLLKFWEVLHSIAMAQIDQLPAPNKQREFKTVEDAFIFTPILYFDQTKILLKKWLGFSAEKIERIIKFFTFIARFRSRRKAYLLENTRRFFAYTQN